jgi:transposase
MGAPRKLPSDAFEVYLGLGRSYQAVADHYGVRKSTVAERAKAQGRQACIDELERTARVQFEVYAAPPLRRTRG